MSSNAARKPKVDYMEPRFHPCASCSDGWLDYGGFAKRCYCWLAHQQKVFAYRLERDSKKPRGTSE